MLVKTLQASDYPKTISAIRGMPKTLYCKGDSDLIKSSLIVGIVGTRKPTDYGKRVVKKLISGLSGSNLVIVSGFMYGIDSIAHKSALEFGLKTIAVLPYGITYPPPSYQNSLYKDILKTGLLVSEYEGSLPPKKWMFPNRNRIIAALCKSLIVVEASKDSGSLITANYALKYKRHLFSVPGELFKSQSYGTNDLIKKDANILTSSSDILNFYGICNDLRKNRPIFNDSLEEKIFNFISEKPSTLDFLFEFISATPSEITHSVMSMQLRGHLVEINGVLSVS